MFDQGLQSKDTFVSGNTVYNMKQEYIDLKKIIQIPATFNVGALHSIALVSPDRLNDCVLEKPANWCPMTCRRFSEKGCKGRVRICVQTEFSAAARVRLHVLISVPMCAT